MKKEKTTFNYEDIVIRRFNAYKEFLIENGVKEELIELPAIKDIILDTIRNGDPRVIFEGRSPIHYQDPKEDGTFNICGRLDGPTVSTIYEMELIDQDDIYLKLTKKDVRHHLYEEDRDLDEIFYINHDGYFINKKKSKYKMLTK